MTEKIYEMKFPNRCRKPYWYGITTNGFVKTNGEAVMGRGVALQAAEAYSWLPRMLGQWLLRKEGNQCYFWAAQRIFTFPVKHHWKDAADVRLIEISARQLAIIAESFPLETFILPRPGCGNGGLVYADVRPVLMRLPDNVWVVDRSE